MATTVRGVLAGRSVLVDRRDADGTQASATKAISQIERKYIVLQESVAGTALEELALSAVQGLPRVGDVHHSSDPSLVVRSIKFDEGVEGEKKKVVATVSYGRRDAVEQEMSSSQAACAVEQWGWRAGSVQRDLLGIKIRNQVQQREPVVNSFGDPFDSVPQIDFPSPVFTKVFKTASRLDDMVKGYLHKINAESVTIGGSSYPARTLRCVQCDEERILGDALFRYRYTVGLQYLSNVVRYYEPNGQGGGQFKDAQEIGWDVAIADMGLRFRDQNNEVRRATDKQEDGSEVPASLPVALDGNGHRLAETTAPNPDNVVFLRVQAYETVRFPAIFTSEPS